MIPGQKCVIYCRVSTPGQVYNGHGIDSQEQLCRQYAQRQSWVISQIFMDKGISGKDTENRPQLNAMLKYMQNAKEPHIMLFYDISRLSRDAGDFNLIRRIVEKQGHTLATVEGILEQTPIGKFIATMNAAHGQLMREENAIKNKERMIERCRQGYWVFQPPWGYKYQKVAGNKILVIMPEIADIIKEAFTGYATARFEQIADVQRFITTKRQNIGLKKYSITQTKTLLTEAKYTGVFAFPKFGIPVQKWHHRTNYRH